MKNSSPQTRLTIAFPLVSAGPGAIGRSATWRASLECPPKLLSRRLGRIGRPPQCCCRKPRRMMPLALLARETSRLPRAKFARNILSVSLCRQCASLVPAHLRPTSRFDMVASQWIRDECHADRFVSALRCPHARDCGLLPRLRPLHAGGSRGPRQSRCFSRERSPGRSPTSPLFRQSSSCSSSPTTRIASCAFTPSSACLLWGAAILVAIALKLAGLVLFLIPVLGPLLVVLTLGDRRASP